MLMIFISPTKGRTHFTSNHFVVDRLVGKLLCILHNAYAMIRVFVMHVGYFILRHVTGDASLFRDWTCPTSMLRSRLRSGFLCVAIQTGPVIGPSIAYKRLVWVVASHAGQPRISFSPTPAAL